MPSLFFEILCEEIPARMQSQARADLKSLFEKAFSERNLAFKGVETLVTPRRLIFHVEELAASTQARTEERRGPKIDAPEQAIQGFLRGAGATLEDCTQENGYWFLRKTIEAQSTRELIPEIFQEVLQSFSWPKSMRWPESKLPWVRPIRGVLCLYDNQHLEFEIPMLSLKTQRTTVGHRFLAPQPIEIKSFEDYKQKLESAFVIVDPEARKARIAEQLDQLSQKIGVSWVKDEVLLQEVTGLVEYPVVRLGQMNESFLRVPAIVLMTSMRVHQRYFAFQKQDGTLAPYFAAVANTHQETPEMIQGFEKVLTARLNDAAFFWDHDRNIPLDSYVPALEQIIFHGKLGTLAQKVKRLQQLVSTPQAQRAALLCKSDLLTQMVGEFPELQGQMGEIYAAVQGEPHEVSRAIRAHYQPLGPQDVCPRDSVSIDLALADKVDTLMGFFAIGELPTGSRDPYGLRRAALGIIRLIRENTLKDLDLTAHLQKALDLYKAQGVAIQNSQAVPEAYEFILERLAVALKAEGIRYDAVQAVITPQQRQNKTLWSMAIRAQALNELLNTADGQALFTAARRSSRILENGQDRSGINASLLQEAAEKSLASHIEDLKSRLKPQLQQHTYDEAMRTLSTIRPHVDQFFESITVNCEDEALRKNRHNLLHALTELFEEIADFSKLEG